MQRNYKYLRSLWFSNSQISSNNSLLNKNTESLQKNYKVLVNLGLLPKKINQYANLLWRRQSAL